MILTTVLGLAVWGQVVLPGSDLTLTHATRAAETILVAKIATLKTPVLAGPTSWSECSLTSVTLLKREPNSFWSDSVSIHASGPEALPRVGDERIFFLGKRGSFSTVLKVLPDTPLNRAAIRDTAGQGGLTGSSLTLEQATLQARVIVVGLPRWAVQVGAGGSASGLLDLKVAAVLKGKAAVSESRRVSVQPGEPEMEPQLAAKSIYFLSEFDGHDQTIKIVPDTAANRAAISLVCQEIQLPGSKYTFDQARALSHTIVVGQPTSCGIIIGLGPFFSGSYDFKACQTWQGEAPAGGWNHLSVQASGQEQLPVIGRDYIIFVGQFTASDRTVHDHVVKILPFAPANLEAVKTATGPTPQPNPPGF